VAKRCVFRRRLKVPSVSDAVTLDGKVFETRGAATKNARSPIVVRHEDDVTRADVVEDRSLFLESTSATRRSLLARYGGAVQCRNRKTSTESLNYTSSARLWLGVKRGDSDNYQVRSAPDAGRPLQKSQTLIRTMQTRRANVIRVGFHTCKLTQRPRTVPDNDTAATPDLRELIACV